MGGDNVIKIKNAKIYGELSKVNKELKEELNGLKNQKETGGISTLVKLYEEIRNNFEKNGFMIVDLSEISFIASYEGLHYQVYLTNIISICRDEMKEIVISVEPASRINQMQQVYNTEGYLTEEIEQLEKENRELKFKIASIKDDEYSYWIEGDNTEYFFIDAIIKRIFN